jgi:hypothetical protein
MLPGARTSTIPSELVASMVVLRLVALVMLTPSLDRETPKALPINKQCLG